MGRSSTNGSLHRRDLSGRPSPTGHVRKSWGHMDGAVAAATFRGLPEGIAHPKQLLEPLRRCGSRLPFQREALATLELLFDYTKLSDWEEGGMPLVFPGNAELAGCLGVSDRTVRNHLSALEQAGMIAIQRGPGNRRVPVWNGAGEIVVPYGINLAPLCERSEDLRRIGQEQAERRKALKRVLQQIGEALQDIRTAADAVEVVIADSGEVWEDDRVACTLKAIAEQAEDQGRLARRIWERDAAASPEEQEMFQSLLASIRDRMIDWAGEANTEAMVKLSPEITQISGDPETNVRDNSTKTYPSHSKGSQKEVVTGDALGDPSERPFEGAGTLPMPELPGLERRYEAGSHQEAAFGPLPVRGSQLLSICPDFGSVLRNQLLCEEPETAPAAAYHDAARLIALGMGVTDWCWRTGCGLHGRTQALMAVAVALMKPREQITKSRQAFLAGMLLRPQGQLNALASYHALRKRRQEE